MYSMYGDKVGTEMGEQEAMEKEAMIAKDREEHFKMQRAQAQNSPLAQQLNDLAQVLNGLTDIVTELEQRMSNYVPATDDLPQLASDPVPGARGSSAPVLALHTFTLQFIEQGERIRRILHAVEL